MEHSVEKRVILSHWKKIRQISYLVISLVKPLLSRNFCEKSVRDDFCNFHSHAVPHGDTLAKGKNSWNQLILWK